MNVLTIVIDLNSMTLVQSSLNNFIIYEKLPSPLELNCHESLYEYLLENSELGRETVGYAHVRPKVIKIYDKELLVESFWNSINTTDSTPLALVQLYIIDIDYFSIGDATSGSFLEHQAIKIQTKAALEEIRSANNSNLKLISSDVELFGSLK